VIAQRERNVDEPQLEPVVAPQSAATTAITVIEPLRGWFALGLNEIWVYRELVFFLIWRDVKVRYKQTAIGAAWAVLQPLLTMVMFTVVFKKLAGVSSDGLPYSVFAYTALLPWNFFATALGRSSTSVVGESNLISKVYFPRLIVPLAASIVGIVDFAVAFVMLIVMMIWYGIAPTWHIVLLPVFLFLTLMTALAVGLWLSAFNVKFRDVAQISPFLIQLWLFASPVAYSVSAVAAKDNGKWLFLYSLNPMVGVIEGFRWALLGKQSPDFGMMAMSAVVIFALLFGGVVYFKRMERSFADII
jgi:lipopolysaccharide transport system permease protein